MPFGPDLGHLNKMVTGRNAIRSCSAPGECCECSHFKDNSFSATRPDRSCIHPSTFNYSLNGFDVSRGRPGWCPYNVSVVRS
jgi:hypothetical protein